MVLRVDGVGRAQRGEQPGVVAGAQPGGLAVRQRGLQFVEADNAVLLDWQVCYVEPLFLELPAGV